VWLPAGSEIHAGLSHTRLTWSLSANNTSAARMLCDLPIPNSPQQMIKSPGPGLTLYTLLLMAAGCYVAYDAFAVGKTGLGFVFAMLPLGCALMWLDIREAKWLVVVYLGIATLGAGVMMLANGFSWSLAIRGIIAGCGAYQFATWNGNPNA
jgi:hypothetical protein